MTKKTEHPAIPTPTSPATPDSSASAQLLSTGGEGPGPGSWFGDFNALCISSCIPLPTCNLLLPVTTFTGGNETLTSYSQSSSPSASSKGLETFDFMDRCLNTGWPVRDVGAVVVSILGLAFVTRQILCKSRRMFSAVGRTEIGFLYMIYSFILLLQIFTVGGVLVPENHQNFLMWATALHLGALVCFFWTLIITALVLFQFTDDGTNPILTRFILLPLSFPRK
ncbi:hypothetical protein EC991_003666 [Linnemannia zychae]|nr:hypothetical protein EC991_003666 [Linnemannia zychae]